MYLASVLPKKDVIALVFNKDVTLFTFGYGDFERRVTLTLFNVLNADVSEAQFYTEVYPDGKEFVFEVLDGLIYNDLAFHTDYCNGDVDSLKVERSDFVVFDISLGAFYGSVNFGVSDLLDYSFGRYTSDISNLLEEVK